MTARADCLTHGARTPDHAGFVRSSYPASSVRVFVGALERLDYRMAPLLAEAGIHRADLDDPDARITRSSWGRVFSRALEQRPMKNAGMRLATVTPFGAFPLIDYLIATSQNVGEGLTRLGRIGGDDTRIQAIARALGTSARSLQRRLAIAGVSYRQLVDVARKDAAERYLSDTCLSIGEIAYLLGYSEAAAFNRAFRRWRHERPQVFRQRQRRGQS